MRTLTTTEGDAGVRVEVQHVRMKFGIMLGIEFHPEHFVSAVVEGFGTRSRPSE